MADKPKSSLPEITSKLRSWCARQERSQREVIRKIGSLGIYGPEANALLTAMIAAGFVNEMRFAEAFVSGKANIKSWGRVKILQELRKKGVTDNMANKALSTLDREEYTKRLRHVVSKYLVRQSNKYSGHELKARAIRYLMGKGYEYAISESEVSAMLSQSI